MEQTISTGQSAIMVRGALRIGEGPSPPSRMLKTSADGLKPAHLRTRRVTDDLKLILGRF